jgi:protein-disulfide isomerase
LFVIFLIGILQAWARGLELSCGCFGGGGPVSGGATYILDVLRDVGLLVLAVYLIVWPFTRWSLDEYLRRHDHVEMPSAKRMRTDAGRRKYEAEVARKTKDARIRETWINAGLATIVILVTLIGIGVQSGRAKVSGNITATNATVANGVVFGKKAAATVDLYEDFQCPHCMEFEQSAGAVLDSLVRSNHAQIRYHTLSFLDAASNGNRYSSRAANAALCASDVSVDKFVAYHRILFGKVGGKQVQPEEGSNGRSDTDFVRYARLAGITGNDLTTFSSCVSSEQHKGLVQAITDRASRDGITGTPTVKVNGKTVDATRSAVVKAIAAADAKGPKPSPSVTPKPSPSVTPKSSPSVTPKSSTPASTSPKPSPTATATRSG